MSEPNWVFREEVERLQKKVIETAGGLHGVRDPGLLESAIARPRNLYAYGEKDLFQIAASYAEISRHQSLNDGNKRTAFAVTDLFLRRNGFAIQTRDDDGHVIMMENLGQGKISREDASIYLRENSRKLEREQSRSDTIRSLESQDIAKEWTEKKLQKKGDNQEEKPIPPRYKQPQDD